MTITQVHSIFKERFNRLASDYHEDLSPYQIDRFLNDGMFELMQLTARNEQSTKHTNLFASIIYTDTVTPTVINNTYRAPIDNLMFPFYEYKRVVAKTNCGDVNVQLETYGRIGDLLKDAFSKPSKKWKRLLATTQQPLSGGTDREMVIYSEEGFIVNTVEITYVRYPKDVFFGGYDTPDYLECVNSNGTNCDQYDNQNTPRRTIDIHENYHTLFIDYAVQEALRSLGLGNEFALRQAKTAQNLINQ